MAIRHGIVAPEGAVRWRIFVGLVPGIGDPFADVAMHVEEAEPVGRLRADRLGLSIRVLEVPSTAAKVGVVVTERKASHGAGPRRIFTPQAWSNRMKRSYA